MPYAIYGSRHPIVGKTSPPGNGGRPPNGIGSCFTGDLQKFPVTTFGRARPSILRGACELGSGPTETVRKDTPPKMLLGGPDERNAEEMRLKAPKAATVAPWNEPGAFSEPFDMIKTRSRQFKEYEFA